MDLATIQKRIEQLDGAQNEIRILKQTLDDALKEDDRYQEMDLALRDLTIKKKQLKDEIWRQEALQDATRKIKELKEEMADLSEILNHELLAWRQEHNSDEIIGSDGATRKVKISVRLQTLRTPRD